MSPAKREWLNGDDFVRVSPAMAKDLGGDFLSAAVAGRIAFRIKYWGYDRDGLRWWRSSLPSLADDMGLTEKQVRRAVGVLAEADMLLREKHKQDGAWDQTFSFAIQYEGNASALEGGTPVSSALEGGPPAPDAG